MGTLTKGRRKSPRRQKSPHPKPSLRYGGKDLTQEPYNYDGPAPEGIIESISSLLKDLFLELELSVSTDELEELIIPLRMFCDAFFQNVITRKNGLQMELFGDMCKERYKDFISFINLYLSDFANDSGARIHLFSKAGGNDVYAVDLSQVKYLPRRLQGFFVTSEEGELTGKVVLSHRPKYYGLLYRFILQLTSLLTVKGVTSFNDPVVQQLFLIAGSLAQLFEKTNVSKDIIQDEYIIPTLDMLTGEEAEMSEETIKLMEAVIYDLDLDNNRRTHPPYVREIRKAYMRNKHHLFTPFEVQDLYVATKATASSIDGFRHKSIIASLYETDPIRGLPEVEAFDAEIGYDSSLYYREEALDKYQALVVKTIWIPNPNKRKPRAIHIGMNAIQDRCKWLHRRAVSFLRAIPSDHLKDHFGGVQFLMRYTHPGYRMQHENSILNFDFSNATDTLSKEFQYRVVQLFHGTAAADFWRAISTLQKVAIMEDGTEIGYVQSVGQPQGLLGSFDLFSEAHHMIMLMVMKATGREDLLASEFYAVVGDDSAINTITPDPDGSVKDSYYKICTEANLIVNLSKSHIYSGDPSEDVLLDFAKTTVRNGQLFTPVPAGLGLSYSDKSMLGGVATILWYASKGIVLKKAMDASVSRNFRNWTQRLIAMIVIKSGEIPYLSAFKDEEFMQAIPEDLKKAVLFSYLVNSARSTVFDFCLSEVERDRVKASDLTLQYAWERVAPSYIEEDVVRWMETAPMDNKYRYLLEDVFKTQRALLTLYHGTVSDFQAEIVAETLHDKDLSILHEIAGWIQDLKDTGTGLDVEPAFWSTFEIAPYLSGVKELGELHIPSFAGKNRQKARLFKGLIPTFKEFFNGNQHVVDLLSDTNSSLIELFCRLDGIDTPPKPDAP